MRPLADFKTLNKAAIGFAVLLVLFLLAAGVLDVR
jgi:hypothetical protein